MAGEAIGLAILQTLIEKLTSTVVNQLVALWCVKKDLYSLKSTLVIIQGVLENAEERSLREKPLCDWLKRLKDAACDAEDLLDEFETELQVIHEQMATKFRRCFSHSNPIAFQFKTYRGVTRYHLERRDVTYGRMELVPSRETVSDVNGS